MSDRKGIPLYSRHHVATQGYEGHLQGARMSAAAERKQAERALQKQSQLAAAAIVQERNTADRNRFVQIMQCLDRVMKLCWRCRGPG